MPEEAHLGAGVAGAGDARAVVVGLDCMTGLQTARILSERGVVVHAITGDPRHWATRTRACVDVVAAPLTGEGLLAGLRRLRLDPGQPAVLMPCTDEAVEQLSAHRDRLPPGMVLPLAEHAVVELLLDKVRFAQRAAAAGLPVPRTEILHGPQDVQRVAGELEYPVVLKPASKTAQWRAHTTRKAWQVEDAAQLQERYRAVAGWTPVLLAQECVVGPETGLYSCNAYFGRDGRPLATFVARKVRQWPPLVGTSASGEECRNDEVLATTLRLFEGLRFHGLAYLEMKRDERTGRLLIIEPNVGRPTGRSAIAEAGGVELLLTAFRDALGLPLPAARTQRYGDARWLDVRRDAQAAFVAHRAGQLSWGEWLRWLRGPKAHAIWSARDPAPFVVDLVQAGITGARMVRARRRDDGRLRRGSQRSVGVVNSGHAERCRAVTSG